MGCMVGFIEYHPYIIPLIFLTSEGQGTDEISALLSVCIPSRYHSSSFEQIHMIQKKISTEILCFSNNVLTTGWHKAIKKC